MSALTRLRGLLADRVRQRDPAFYALPLGRAALNELGWIRSAEAEAPVDRDGRPVPWMTYPAISFLRDRTRPSFRVFEYGSGNSTRWWAPRVASVVACEHDRHWFDQVSKDLPENAVVMLRDVDSEAYPRAAMEIGGVFDIIVIDGRRRVDCAHASLSALADDGVVVWDDTNRVEYAGGFTLLEQNAFRRLDFEGITPASVDLKSTSVFYRDRNCFGI